jgi:hypothetical protein
MIKILQFGSDSIEKILIIAVGWPFISWFPFAHADTPLFYFFLFLLQRYKKGAPFWGTPKMKMMYWMYYSIY